MIPLVGTKHGNAENRRKAYFRDARALYDEGFEKFKGRVFRITAPDGKANNHRPCSRTLV